MLLDFLITAIAGGAVFKNEIQKGETAIENRNNARTNGNKIYFDGECKNRSTETNEVVSWQNHTGHHQYVGIKTGKIYHDSGQEKLDKLNHELEISGKKFIWTDYPQWKDSKGRRMRMHFDIEKGLPYILKREKVICYPLYSKPDNFYIYYITDMNSSTPWPDYNNGRKLSHEEEKLYMDQSDYLKTK